MTRDTTERAEAITTGSAKLIGTSSQAQTEMTDMQLNDPVSYRQMPMPKIRSVMARRRFTEQLGPS